MGRTAPIAERDFAFLAENVSGLEIASWDGNGKKTSEKCVWSG